jgi:catechol 2,3-dioxygenase-like lactoylglutathione lyase family enzyme
MIVTGIDHVLLRVRDLDGAVAFYSNVLGCPVERRTDALGFVQLRAGDSLIDLVAVDGQLGRAGGAAPGSEGRNMDHFCLRVASFHPEGTPAELSRRGAIMTDAGTRYGATGEGPSIYLVDSEGNRLELRG